ncbi:neurofilament medium polypeptide protein [Phialemonium atrogriseum]|uniref:Neurofilament medium polypeptide protein n=1 Tax=Phialemonium atrogriseum TaxID=1093897 RepID=A0AAJ0FQ89_9PEZI|nr:neurofilament medium polypeptide protein [Phialemonium atrogriseum]KAK1768915.1 neurofilament medium polypeptide protein [Phialemonium atrogriseum]
MKYYTLLALLATGSTASINVADDISRGFRMGVLPRQAQVNNLQAFTSGLGGVGATAITQSNDPKRQFDVDGDTFPDFESAANRACDNQHNECARKANNGGGAFSVPDCDKQSTQCKAAIGSATKTSFVSLFKSDDQFDIFCDT